MESSTFRRLWAAARKSWKRRLNHGGGRPLCGCRTPAPDFALGAGALLRVASIATVLFWAAQGAAVPPAHCESLSAALPLDAGYLQMYNLEFREAQRTFISYGKTNPHDPVGPTSEAASYLFSEFHRLGILRSEFFTDDDYFKRMQVGSPDPELKAAFENALSRSDRLAGVVRQHCPDDANARFAQLMNLGLRALYSGLVERRHLVALGYVKKAGALGERLLSAHPSYYDAYLALGIENYLLGLRSAPVRWLVRLYGAHADKERGIEILTLTAEKGHYLLPYARLLLAFAAMREKEWNKARELLECLSREFPMNPLYARELARLPQVSAPGTR